MGNPEKLRLRFRAGRFEDRLAYAIASLRAWIIVMIGVFAFGLVYFVAGALGSETATPADYAGGVPLLLGLVVVAVLLGKLYDTA